MKRLRNKKILLFLCKSFTLALNLDYTKGTATTRNSKMNHTELITRLRSGAVIELEQFAFGGVANFADEAADMIEAVLAERDEYQQAADKMAMEHKVERDTLRQQLAEAKALIEASRKQKPVAYKGKNYGNLHHHDFGNSIPLFAAPVVAPDVLSALKMAVLQNSHDMLMTGEEIRKCELAIQAAMVGAND